MVDNPMCQGIGGAGSAHLTSERVEQEQAARRDFAGGSPTLASHVLGGVHIASTSGVYLDGVRR